MINDNYNHITKLVKSKQIFSKIEINKTKKTGIYRFSGNKLEDLINKPNELKNIVGFISDLHFDIYNKINKTIPIQLEINLNQTRINYNNYYKSTKNPMFQKLTQIKGINTSYFDLCFYTLCKYKTADYIGFPGFEFWENNKFINNYIKEFQQEFQLKSKN
jgi:hypothetical protein